MPAPRPQGLPIFPRPGGPEPARSPDFAPVDTARDAYALAATLDVLDARDRAAKLLQRAGATTVEAPSGRLAAAAVQAYLRAKSRAR